ncbi:uncharacterized protein LOC111342768 [Stylophora pistillata]|uniref:uncharacterized protein LOC111342768 n=1 Tax=Stylophora pistillata TaxID=50429 RepID=UPI000C047631|nr:uncharacterized protein LOC111342768 [Stylophora pistillata]
MGINAKLVWATSRHLGCGVSFCEKSAGRTPHPWAKEATVVVCDYAPGGNLINEFPYQIGKPCSKCASGKGFCYKNLCRNCDDFDRECGRSLTLKMCTGFKDFMAKKCPKMCNLCECPLECQHGGKLNAVMCTCACPPGYKGLDCSEIKSCPPGYFGEHCQFHCFDMAGPEVCHWRISNGHDCSARYMQHDCAASCGICGSHVTQSLKPPQLPATPKPLVAGTKMHPAYLPATIPDAKTLGKGSTVTLSSNATESKPAVAASVVTSNKSTNVTLSIGHVNAPNVTSGRQVTLARSFTNVTVGRADQLKGVLDKLVALLDEHSRHGSVTNCKNVNPLCTLWSAMGKCKYKARLMKKHCCATCKKVMDIPQPKECKDNSIKCPFWALAGECTRDRIWMQVNCKKSCNHCGVCQDKGPKCADLALLRKCAEGDKGVHYNES